MTWKNGINNESTQKTEVKITGEKMKIYEKLMIENLRGSPKKTVVFILRLESAISEDIIFSFQSGF